MFIPPLIDTPDLRRLSRRRTRIIGAVIIASVLLVPASISSASIVVPPVEAFLACSATALSSKQVVEPSSERSDESYLHQSEKCSPDKNLEESAELVELLADCAVRVDCRDRIVCTQRLASIGGNLREDAETLLVKIVHDDMDGNASVHIAATLMNKSLPVSEALLSALSGNVTDGFSAEGLVLHTSRLLFRELSPREAMKTITKWNDHSLLHEIVTAWYFHLAGNFSNSEYTEEEYVLLRRIPTQLVKSQYEVVRIAGLRLYVGMLGPDLYANTQEQLAINIQVRDLLRNHLKIEESQRVRDFLEDYLLLGFAADGQLLKKSDWRQRIMNNDPSALE